MKCDDKVIWRDPDHDHSSGVYTIVKKIDNETYLISNGVSEAEVPEHEMTKFDMKNIDDIIETLVACYQAIPDYELSKEGGDLINQGWIEGLEYVLGVK